MKNARKQFDIRADVSGWSALQAADSGEQKLRRFTMTAYTGGPMTLAGWNHPVVVDLTGLRIPEKPRPILKDHNPSLVIGHTESIGVNNSELRLAGVISGAGRVADEVVQSSVNGFPWQASIGARTEKVKFIPKGEKAKANGQSHAGPFYLVQKSALGEVSFVALGADENTSAQIAARAQTEDTEVHDMTFEQWLEANGFDIDNLNDKQQATLKAAFDASQRADQRDANSTEGENGTDAAELSGAGAEAVTAVRAQLAAETKRISAIRKLCAGRHSDLEAKAIEEGWDETRAELEVLRASRPAGPAIHDRSEGHNGQSLEAALCMTAGLTEQQVGKWYNARTMEAALSRDHRGAGLHSLLYEVIRAAGGWVRPGRVDNETIRAAFDADRQLRASGSGFSTISLSGILSNVANKSMLAAYNAVATVVARFCNETDVNDFKQVTRYRLTGNGVFEKVGPDGELKHATLGEESYTNQIDTYGRLIALTRQMMINDDLGAFLAIPRIIGRMSALKREEAVFELLLSNPATFFSAGHKNYIEGAGTALSIDALTQAEQLFSDQVDSDGKPVLLTAAVLLIPTSLKVTAQQLMTETRVNEDGTGGKPKPANNPHAGKWQPVASPYLNAQGLTGSSATGWYLFADPADVAAMEIAYLRGKRTPTIESGDTDFNTLGMQWRGYFDFGVAMQDHRAAIKSKGAA